MYIECTDNFTLYHSGDLNCMINSLNKESTIWMYINLNHLKIIASFFK